MHTSRRNFLLKAGIGSAALASIPTIVSSCVAPQNKDNEDENPRVFSRQMMSFYFRAIR